MTSRILILIFATSCIASLARADDADYSRSGLYLALDAAIGVPFSLEDEYDSILALQVPISAVDPENFAQRGRTDAIVGLSGRIGYRLIPRLALEAQFEWLPGFKYTITNNQDLVEGNTFLVTANARGYVIEEGRFQPFLMLGAGYMRSKSEFFIGNTRAGVFIPASPLPPNLVCVGPLPLAFASTPPCRYVPGSTETVQGFAARFGGGFDAYVTRSIGIAITISYVLPTGSARDLDYLSTDIGVFYRF